MTSKNKVNADWVLRVLKGGLIGTGFLLPGVSGGALAAVFGLYERMISFMAHPTKDFRGNMLFFFPVGVGMAGGIVLLAYPLGFFLENYFAPTMWFFIGAVLGTFPSLWKDAGKEGRELKHIRIMTGAFVLGFIFFQISAQGIQGELTFHVVIWMLAGCIMALGVVVPGLSPSNLLLYLGMYGAMIEACKRLDMTVLLPIAGGGLVCLLIFSKVADGLLNTAYTVIFHIILGIVMASTLMIVPMDYSYLGKDGLICLIICAGGILLGNWMCGLKRNVKKMESVI